ncbi:substrate-binding periplasmic protein [Pseudomonas sp. NPDC090202]|uniref:substrate-binding periplasmic protein n=1 Tax=unclassified Pseudomonas TaxID=196821 RepID=UPI0037F2F6A4
MPAKATPAFSGGWIRYGLAALIGAGAVCAVWLLPMLDDAESGDGPVLAQARQHQLLRLGVRSYPRPTDSSEALVSEPDDLDSALASALGQYLGIEVQLVAIPGEDISALLAKGQVDAVLAGSLEVPGLKHQRAALRDLPDGYRHGALVALRNAALTEAAPKGQSVCVAFGSPWAVDLQERGAQLRTYPSTIRAATAFMAGECKLLADERTVLTSLLQTPDWRFYRMLPQGLEASADAQVYLAQPDRKSLRQLQAGLRDWQSKGGQVQAWDLHSNAVLLDSLKLADGLVCH